MVATQPTPSAMPMPRQNSALQIQKNLFASVVLVAAWAGAGALSAPSMGWLEVLNSAGVLLGIIAGGLIWRGPGGLAGRAVSRLWSVAMFIAAGMMLSPIFHHSHLSVPVSQWGALNLVSLFLPIGAMFVLLIMIPGRKSNVVSVSKIPPASNGLAEQLERFCNGPLSMRLNFAAAGAVIIAANAGMSGLPIQAALPQSALFALAILTLPALLQIAANPAGSRVLSGTMALALSVCVLTGTYRHRQLWQEMEAANTLLKQDKVAEASQHYNEAAAINAVLADKKQVLALETDWAQFHERRGDTKAKDPAQEAGKNGEYELSLVHWRNVADQRGLDGFDFLPIRRVLCKEGDSLTAWRRLIFQGFPSINDPEIAPGIMAMGDLPNQKDARAALLAALLSWDQNATDAERRRRLELVQRIAPFEPSSYNLLKRMNAKLPEGPLWLPSDMIVGVGISETSLLGDIAELGEVDTLVVLDSGRWEMGVSARATPMHEEWPILRVEFYSSDGGKTLKHEVGRTQVTRPDNYEVPFTFNVNRGNIYHIKLVFENRQKEFDEGHLARRGLVINGLSFRKAKE